jgi:putative FmdB family regulatory protein
VPIYEYLCGACAHEFEAFLRKPTDDASCPACQSANLERVLSMPRVHSEARKGRSMRAAKRRDKSQAHEAAYTQRQYELNHDDH